MDSRLYDLYKLPQDLSEQEIYLQDLAYHCACLEEQVRRIMESLSAADCSVLEDYLDTRNELVFQSVKRALKIGKRHSQSYPISHL